MKARELCRNCKKGTVPPGLVVEGEPTYDTMFDGKAREKRTRYRCPACGALWEHLEESGVGGHGSFWNLVKPSPAAAT